MENPIILITSSEDEYEDEEERAKKVKKTSESERVVTVRSIKEEYRMIADLSGFDNLKAMYEAEAFMRSRRKMRKRNKKKTIVEFQAQVEVVTADATEVKDGKYESVETVEALKTESVKTVEALKTESVLIPENDVSPKLLVDAPKEREQADTIKAVETTNTSGAGNGVNSTEMIDRSPLPLKDNGASSDMSICRDVGQTLPTEVIVWGKNNRSRIRRENIRMLIRGITVDSADKEKQAKTCNGVETMISLETESAGMKDNIVLRQLLRKPRYFDPPVGSWSTCSNCWDEDHAAVNCTMQKRKKPCSLCGSFEHIWKHCSQFRDCFVYKERGHLSNDCPGKHQENNLSSNFCLRCGDSGHDMFSCRNDYSTDDLKEIQCYVCKSFGHLCCVDLPDMDPSQDTCYNCGQSNHSGNVCPKLCRVTRGSKSPVLCDKCGQEGHFARSCTDKFVILSFNESWRLVDLLLDGQRGGDFSTPAHKLPNKMRSLMGPNTAPPVFY